MPFECNSFASYWISSIDGVRQQQCVGCGATIWVARKLPVAPPKICIQCVQRDVTVAPILN
jgi:hypothetical protein